MEAPGAAARCAHPPCSQRCAAWHCSAATLPRRRAAGGACCMLAGPAWTRCQRASQGARPAQPAARPNRRCAASRMARQTWMSAAGATRPSARGCALPAVLPGRCARAGRAATPASVRAPGLRGQGMCARCPAPAPNRAPLLKRARCHSRYSTRCLSPTRTRICRRGRDAGRAQAASAEQRRRRLGGCTRPASGVRKQTRWWQSNMQASKP